MKVKGVFLLFLLAVSFFDGVRGTTEIANSSREKKGVSWVDLMKKELRFDDFSIKGGGRADAFPDIHTAYFTQPLNHFDAHDNRTWQQPYYYKDDEYKPGAPVYLHLGGESKTHPNSLRDAYEGLLAKEQCAFMIVLQHRFYGDTIPEYPDDDVLKYLSAEQAIHDAASFVTFANEHFNLTGPWIVIGCSYPANLAAWSRATFPHLFSAAYSSSGPVLAKYDNSGYMEVVANGLENTSKQCSSMVKAGMKTLSDLVQKGDSETIQQLFNTCDPLDTKEPDDVMFFASNVARSFSHQFQYAADGTIARICKMFTDSKDKPLDTLANYVRTSYGGDCLLVDYQEVYDQLSYPKRGNQRLWTYQLCTELGTFFTIPRTNKVFGALPVTVDHLQKMCRHIFDFSISPEVTIKGIERTNRLHGGDKPTASRVLYVHGSIDPWSALRPTSDANRTSKIIFIKGSSHCLERRPPLQHHPMKSIERARVAIRATLRSWVPNTVQC